MGTNPPLLAAMGLSVLQEEENMGGPSPTPPNSQQSHISQPHALQVCDVFYNYDPMHEHHDKYLYISFINCDWYCIHLYHLLGLGL